MEEQQQEKHWQSAQSLELGLDLIAAARSQLRFLSAVDSHPSDLYRGPAVNRAVARYENCWLPLLAEHGSYTKTGLPLIPPLDCAWIWHCHRLNPVQYVNDCKACYGKLLDAPNVPTDKESEAVACTQQLWDSQFLNEKYDVAPEDFLTKKSFGVRRFEYDLQAAVERQSSFFYQVSRPHMGDPSFLKAALQHYKGFLYLLKLSGLQVFLVPTYDIDLMWHSHQASPGVYQEDTMKLLGRVLNHDDTDSDRTEGHKLDIGFKRTSELWKHTFGSSYERAGAMYRGEAPLFPTILPSQSHFLRRSSCQSVEGVEPRKTLQVFVTVEKARNLHIKKDGVVAVRLCFKSNRNMLKLETSWIKGTPNPEWNNFWSFDCEEATQGICFELRSEDLTCCNLMKKSRRIGWVDISWQTLLSSQTLSFNGWLPLLSKSLLEHDQKPMSLRVSISVTPPVPAPFVPQMGPSFRNGCGYFQAKKFLLQLSSSCGTCGGGGCGGCGAGRFRGGHLHAGQRQGGGCGGCGAGGCGNGLYAGQRQGGGCGGCGAGGCGNGLHAPFLARGGGCGGCGAGGCGNNIMVAANRGSAQALGGKCGACGAGGCGNGIMGADQTGVQGGGCGGCGAGKCGNGIIKAT